MVEEREREIRQIVQSISDLNEIFRDLAGMVVEQVWELPSYNNHDSDDKISSLYCYYCYYYYNNMSYSTTRAPCWTELTSTWSRRV